MSSRRQFLGTLGAGALAPALATAGQAPPPGRTTAEQVAPASSPSPAAGAGAPPDWAAVAAQFDVDPKQLFFNCGTLGTCPRPVRERVIETLKQLDSLPTFEYWARCMPRVFGAQKKAAALIGASEPSAVTFTHSTTEGMNIVARGLDWKPGDEVVMTTHEHPGGDSIFKRLEQTHGIRIRRYAMPFAPPSDEEILAGIEALITPRTRMLMVSHVVYTNGLLLPVNALGKLAQRRGLYFLVDGAHPLGQMPIDVQAMECDFYAASGHKWLCAPRGTGLLYVRPSLLERLEPLFVSYDYGHIPKDARAFHAGAMRLNFTWTNNIHDWMGLETAIDFHQALGPARVRERCLSLTRRFERGLRDVPNVEPLPIASPRDTPMLTFKVRGRSNTEAFRALKSLGITVKEVADAELPEPINALRVATHVFNTEEQVDRLLEGLRKVMSA